MQLDHVVTLVVGDYSRDGHNISEEFTFFCNYTQQQIDEAYKAAIADGVPDITKQCEEYEDSCLHYSFVNEWLKKSASTHPFLKPLNDKIFNASFLCDDKISSWAAAEHDTEDDLERARELAKKYGLDENARDSFMSTEDFTLIYLFIAGTKLDNLQFKEANPVAGITIGGYGLYNS